VPLTKNRRLITGCTEQLGKGRLRTVKVTVGVVIKTIQMRVLAGQNRCATGPANRIPHNAPVKTHPFLAQAIDVRRIDEAPTIVVGTDRLISMVVAENRDEVRRLLACRLRQSAGIACRRA
jgi:hypothetical protein